ncbi:hypothetical protein L1987_20114 [Smallanthus sonchifolius]|uniref:Uncharacterized protein n=1 Tax=Smallanthus sonchifolius TaxID=185202 RepID=A0ACB9ISL0_9ASTR|nr:hypothetical protein L1987_20114 [Smallanthus sonchifolius]
MSDCPVTFFLLLANYKFITILRVFTRMRKQNLNIHIMYQLSFQSPNDKSREDIWKQLFFQFLKFFDQRSDGKTFAFACACEVPVATSCVANETLVEALSCY